MILSLYPVPHTGRAELKVFPDGESYLRIPPEMLEQFRGQKVTISTKLYPQSEKRVFELLLAVQLLKRVTDDIHVYAPYLPYARQDREAKPGEAVSADILCSLLVSNGVKSLTTYDCHFLTAEGASERGGLKIHNISAGPELIKQVKEYFKGEDCVVLSPDKGSSYLVKDHSGHSFSKSRVQGDDGLMTKVDNLETDFDARGKNVCIIDDMIATGGTMVKAVHMLMKQGAEKIVVATIHGFFLKNSKEILLAACDGVFTTDSVYPKEEGDLIRVLELPVPENL
jgi:ribose-phosphate pyrophosphokinase